MGTPHENRSHRYELVVELARGGMAELFYARIHGPGGFAKGVAIKPAGDTTPDSGHHHLLIDGKELPPLDAPIPNDATHKHYGKGQTEDTIHLEPGTHTLQLDLGDAAHRQFDPPIVSKKITVHVK